jgi:hypothetical protein
MGVFDQPAHALMGEAAADDDALFCGADVDDLQRDVGVSTLRASLGKLSGVLDRCNGAVHSHAADGMRPRGRARVTLYFGVGEGATNVRVLHALLDEQAELAFGIIDWGKDYAAGTKRRWTSRRNSSVSAGAWCRRCRRDAERQRQLPAAATAAEECESDEVYASDSEHENNGVDDELCPQDAPLVREALVKNWRGSFRFFLSLAVG